MTHLSQRTLLSLALACAAPQVFAQAVLSVDDSSAKPTRGTTMLFTISRSGPTDFPVSVRYTTKDGTALAGRDYTATSGTATIGAGVSSVSIVVPITNRLIAPQARTFTVELSNASAGAGSAFGGAGNASAARYVEGSVTADFNGDGKPDWVLPSLFDSTVTVLRNDTPTNATAATMPVALTLTGFDAPSRPSVGDFNGDGRIDLAVPNANNTSVDILVNTTPALASTFSFTRTTVSSNTFGWMSAVADIDGDGRPDLIVANNAQCRLSVMLNRTQAGAAAPVFSAPVLFVPGASDAYCYALTTLDADGDGKPDIAISDMQTSRVVVLRNTTAVGATAPSFAAPAGFGVAGGATGIASADIDGDGKPDLVTAENGFQTGSTFSVLLNRTAAGATTPVFAVSSFFGPAPYGVALRDLDGDGKPDLAFAALNFESGNGGVWLVKNTTAPGADVPALTEMARLSGGDEPHTVVIADFNGDGRPDLATIDTTTKLAGFFFQRTTTTTPTSSIGDGTGVGTIQAKR